MGKFNIEKWLINYEDTIPKINLFEFKYCYLIWISNKNYKLTWLNSKPTKFNYEKKVILRGYNEPIIFIGYIKYDLSTCSLIKSNINYNCTNIPFLKSHLQKCIRRGFIYKALLTAFLLLENSPTNFLRRLPIIILEDVYTIENFDIIIWFMVMSPYITLPESFKQWILYIVVFITQHPGKHHYDRNCIPSYNKLSTLPISIKSTVYSLMIRKSYGGLKNDMRMIDSIINFWITSYINDNTILLPKIKPKNIIIYKLMGHELYEKSGVDFHCFPKIIDIIHKIYPQFSKLLIKHTIWHKSSKINFRVNINKEHDTIEDCWKIIKQKLHYIQKKYIQNIVYLS